MGPLAARTSWSSSHEWIVTLSSKATKLVLRSIRHGPPLLCVTIRPSCSLATALRSVRLLQASRSLRSDIPTTGRGWRGVADGVVWRGGGERAASLPVRGLGRVRSARPSRLLGSATPPGRAGGPLAAARCAVEWPCRRRPSGRGCSAGTYSRRRPRWPVADQS
jgi:hypothetical protein